MKLKIKELRFLTGRPVCMIHEKTAEEMSLHVGHRVLIMRGKKKIISIVDTVSKILTQKQIAVSDEIIQGLELNAGDIVEVEVAERPHSISLIKKKLKGEVLNKEEIKEIIDNIANNSLTEVEVAFFVSAVYSKGMNLSETKYLVDAMVSSGNKMKLKGVVVDKHSIGGIAGNRTTPIVISICTAAGLVMPKTSSRAITSAAGTVDVIETIAKVNFSVKEIKEIILKTRGCFVWGGALGLAPVDDKIIRIEKIANIDSTAQLLASILSKKISVGSKYILIDIPYGNSAKVNLKKARELRKKFIILGKKFGLKINVLLTDGGEPIGNGIGPVLEIKDVIKVLRREKDSPEDLEKKSVFLAGKLLELSKKAKKGQGVKMAQEILDSGEAFKKFVQIVKAQKGDINNLNKLKMPKFSFDVKAKKRTVIRHIDNAIINELGRTAGCPEDKEAGVYIHKKKGETAEKGEKILTVYSTSSEKLKQAKKFYEENQLLIED